MRWIGWQGTPLQENLVEVHYADGKLQVSVIITQISVLVRLLNTAGKRENIDDIAFLEKELQIAWAYRKKTGY